MKINNVAFAGDILRRKDHILIITHRRPDGDAVGCGAALCRGLRAMGKDAWVLENPDLTERYFEYFEGLVAPKDYEPEFVVTVDCAALHLLCLGAESYHGSIGLAIDHHGSHAAYSEEVWVDSDAAACGEMILELLLHMAGTLPEGCGAPLYLAISTDTGCFQYTNTTANTLKAAAYLTEQGVDTYAINKVMFGTKSMARLKLESSLVDGMEFYSQGKVCVMTLTPEMMESAGATNNDIDDIAGFPRVVEGVQIGILVRQLEDGSSKASVRTAGIANASDICAPMGGGGHPGAAGLTLDVPAAELKRLLLEQVSLQCYEL